MKQKLWVFRTAKGGLADGERLIGQITALNHQIKYCRQFRTKQIICDQNNIEFFASKGPCGISFKIA